MQGDIGQEVQGEEVPGNRPGDLAPDLPDAQSEPQRFPRSGRLDLLLSVEDRNERTHLIYVLVEHKSYPDNRVALQLMHYMAGLWRQWNKLPLPVIHPVVLYHGPRRWTAPTDLVALHKWDPQKGPRDQSEPPRSAVDYPANLRYHLFDLNAIPAEEIERRARAQAYVGLIAFKYVMRRLPDPQLKRLLERSMDPAFPEEIRHALWQYIYGYVPATEQQHFVTRIEQMSYTIPGEPMYSIADSLRDEGIELGKEQGLKQGLEQGRVQELRRVLVRQLGKRFGLTDDDRALVADCADIEDLEAAAERLVEPEATKDTVLGLLRKR